LANTASSVITIKDFEVHPRTGTEALYRPGVAHRGIRCITLLFLYHGTRRDEGSASCPGPSLPLEKNLVPRLGGAQGQFGQVWKISPLPEFEPRSAQPVVSRYTEYATRPTYLLYRLGFYCCGTCLYSPCIIQGYKAKFNLTPVIITGNNDCRQSASRTRVFLLSLPLSRYKAIRNVTRVNTLTLILCT